MGLFRLQGLQGVGFGFEALDLGFLDAGFSRWLVFVEKEVDGVRCAFKGSGLWAQDFEFRVQQ